MSRTWRGWLIGLAAVAVGGCRTATTLTQVPRVDMALTGGNRGYLLGTPPEPTAPRQMTRQMIQATVEVPSFHQPGRLAIPGAGVASPASSELDMSEGWAPSDAPTAETAGPYDTYVVKPGDSLWSIAAKPEVYGKAAGWRRLFDANRALLKSPNRIRAGMTLKIPRGAAAESRPSSARRAGQNTK